MEGFFMTTIPRGRMLRTEAASQYLATEWGVRRKPRVLANLRSSGGGPRYLRDTRARKVIYPQQWLDEFALEILRPATSTSDESAASEAAK
jgi:hypothetical protein